MASGRYRSNCVTFNASGTTTAPRADEERESTKQRALAILAEERENAKYRSDWPTREARHWRDAFDRLRERLEREL